MHRKSKAGRALGTWALLWVMTVVFGFGCAAMQPEKPKTLTPTDRGTVLFLDKYEFKRPPQNWALMKNLEGGDFELGFLLIEKGEFPSQNIFMYDEEPYGSSQDLEKRAKYYCTRFLFNSGMLPEVKKQEKVTVMGREAIALSTEGENPNRNEKAKSKIYLIKKGERIISFVCTQWRPLQGIYDPEPFEYFETFVQSFKFLKPTFYDELNEKIKKLYTTSSPSPLAIFMRPF
jgi:hypothetical protein